MIQIGDVQVDNPNGQQIGNIFHSGKQRKQREQAEGLIRMTVSIEEVTRTDESASGKGRELPSAPVVFFDGVCGMCNQFVDFLLRHDHKQLFLFAPLQGEIAKAHLDPSDTEDLKSIVLIQNGKVFRRSAAVVRVLCAMSGLWKVAGYVLWLIPAPLRDLGYKMVAKIRYRIFGKKESCRLPTAEERARFLM